MRGFRYGPNILGRRKGSNHAETACQNDPIMPEAITPTEYRAFQDAYDFFNAELFGNSLPHVLVTLQRHARAKGYFAPERFPARVEDTTAHELALNPDCSTGRPMN